jgi:photosystem I P700 chlorophyll a apoprotein A2
LHNGFKLPHGKSLYGFDFLVMLLRQVLLSLRWSQSLWLPGWLEAINNNQNSLLFLTIGPVVTS